MSGFFEKISRAGLILAALGIFLLVMSVGDTVTSFKSAKSFEDVEFGEVELAAGDHVEGEVPFLFDSFAIEQTWTENKSNNSRTPKKTSRHYYVMPCGDNLAGLSVGTKNAPEASDLVDQTYGYLSGGAAPTAELTLDCRVVAMEGELVEMFREELKEYYDYTDQEIEDMGALLMVEPRDFMMVRIFCGAGAVLTLLGAGLLVGRWRKVSARQRQEEYEL